MLQTSNIFVTGGAGTLGRAIARRRKQEGWTGKLTVYSRDEHKHAFMRRMFPDQEIQYVQGDIRNLEALKMAMAGHDVVIHAGACKVIPVSEHQSIDTVDINVYGSQNVCLAAWQMGIEHVLGISTDKVCHCANAYGATKYLMEKIFQEYARAGLGPEFHLVRYGNVLESTESVVQIWKQALYNGKPITITDPEMTRFWLSPSQAVDYVIRSLNQDSGCIYIPQMPALSIGKLLDYTLKSARRESPGNVSPTIQRVPLRPGEKLHETLLTVEEGFYAEQGVLDGENGTGSMFYLLHPTTDPRFESGLDTYSSDVARELTEEELEELLYARETV